MATPIGVLTSVGHPLLPYLLDELDWIASIEAVVVLDERSFTAGDTARFAERTEGAFPARSQDDALAGRRHVMVPNHNDPSLREWLAAEGIGLLANGGTLRRIGGALLGAAPVVNAHPGVLPKYRGASCCEWALHNGDPVGVTAHFMDEELDAGPIISTEILDVEPGWRYVDIRVALYRLALRVLARALDEVVTRALTPGDLPPQPRDVPVFGPMPDDVFAALRARIDRVPS